MRYFNLVGILIQFNSIVCSSVLQFFLVCWIENDFISQSYESVKSLDILFLHPNGIVINALKKNPTSYIGLTFLAAQFDTLLMEGD